MTIIIRGCCHHYLVHYEHRCSIIINIIIMTLTILRHMYMYMMTLFFRLTSDQVPD